MREKTIYLHLINLLIIVCLVFMVALPLAAQPEKKEIPIHDIEEKIKQMMEEGDIPGLSLAIISGDQVYTKGFGYADLEKKTPVTPDTLMELSSTSKAFTALGVTRLVKEGKIDLEAPVSTYLPWFRVRFNGKDAAVKVRHLLHHTSGIPTSTIASIPPSNAKDALEKAAKLLVGFQLKAPPGATYQYATINYDVLGAIIETVSGMSFQAYMRTQILDTLGLNQTSAGPPAAGTVATGYKIGFFAPRPYDAPVYKGNVPAGYIVSSGKDMSRWLKFQLGMEQNQLTPAIAQTHEPDRTVPINQNTLGAYCMGWRSYMNGTDLVDHEGMNPNFSSYVVFSPKHKMGIAVIANSNSNHTRFIGYYVTDRVMGIMPDTFNIPANTIDNAGSVVTFMMGIYLLIMIAFFVSVFKDLAAGKRKYDALNLRKCGNILITTLAFLPFIYGIYLLPAAMMDFTWPATLVWTPISFQTAIFSLLAAMGLGVVGLTVSSIFPQRNRYKKKMPMLVVLSLISGGANAVVIFLITASVFNTRNLSHQLYYFSLAFLLYIVGRKILQTELIRITFDIVYDLRMKLVGKILNASFQQFENIDRGRVLATLNDDIGTISNSANLAVMLVTSFVTIVGAFIYLFTIAFWATAITLGIIASIATLYYVVTQKTNDSFEEARDTQNVYMDLLDGMMDGFKELTLHFTKRMNYKDEVAESVDEFRSKLRYALTQFVNAFLIGESLLIIVLGVVGFGFSRFFPDVADVTVMSFIMVLLYLIGPFNALLRSIPEIIRIRVSWLRVKQFSKHLPANADTASLKPMKNLPKKVDQLQASGLTFQYHSNMEMERFTVGPIDFEAKSGEIVFIIGGNGSGKTTLAKLLTGLYEPNEGHVAINGEIIPQYRLGEYYSTVFSDFHLFEKLYNVNLEGKDKFITEHLKMLRLEQKVALQGNTFTNVDLSGGQRKRLSLLQCYLEDHPIYLFDEIAADQDPEFRKFFYRDLLMRMKEQGKIVIAITHDDHYFDVADKIVKLDMGQTETVGADYKTTSATA